MVNKIFNNKYIVAMRRYAVAHKLIASAIATAVLGTGYYGYASYFSSSAETKYILSTVKKGTIVVSVSGTGQVSASNEVGLNAKASGDVVYVGVKTGDKIAKGTLVAQLDASEALKTVRDAEASLESAKISYEKLVQPADKLSVIQAENKLSEAKESKVSAENALEKAYEDGFNTVSNAFLELPGIIAGLKDMLFSASQNSGSQWNLDYYSSSVKDFDPKVVSYRDDTYSKYQIARASYDKNFENYKLASRDSDNATVEALLNETYETTRDMAEAIKSANNLIQFYEDKLIEKNLKPIALADTHLSTLSGYTSKTNSHLLSLLSAKDSIKQDKDSILSAERSIEENTESYANLISGADPLDMRSSQLSVTQKENALLDAKEKLANYYIRAPFDGTVASIDVIKGDSISSGASLGTFVTEQKIAELSLNEVDIAKVKVGQKATLTFDAIDGLEISGQVSEVDAIGAVSQGVVTYDIKIAFDTQDERVKSGMSVNASIVTEVKQDVLIIPGAAIKTSGDTNYIEAFSSKINVTEEVGSQGVTSTETPVEKIIVIGVANDTETEVVSGLSDGDQIIVRTTATKTSSTSSTKSTKTGGGGPGMGGMF